MKIKFKHFRVKQETYDKIPRKKGATPPEATKEHSRSNGNGVKNPSSNGGITQCSMLAEDGRFALGIAYCSLSEAFAYKRGNRLALLRAIMDLAEVGNDQNRRQIEKFLLDI